MKTRSLIITRFEPQRRAGLTILEMLVSTAMLSVIVLGLSAMLIQTQKAFKTGIKENTITDAGRTIMDMMSGDLRQMSDAQNTNSTLTNPYNFFWGQPASTFNVTPVVCYLNSNAVRTNLLADMFILEHTNATWVGVGYAVSNYTYIGTTNTIGIGTLYRYEFDTNSLTPVFTNDLIFSQFYNSAFRQSTFPSNNWHRIADGVISLKVLAYDQYGNAVYPAFLDNSSPSGYPNQYAYPIYKTTADYAQFMRNNASNTNLPSAVDLELGILEPDALAQARVLAGSGNSLALSNFLSSNALPKMEIFRQRITIAAALR